jgi:hypothetical protein
MIGGFNHNFSYKGHTYHVQTEDSGVPRARITTLLYRAGSILARETTDYAAMVKEPDIGSRVEQIMKQQHRTMLKNLKDGAYDAKIAQFNAASADFGAPDTEISSSGGKQGSGSESPRGSAQMASPPLRQSEWEGGRLEKRLKAYLDAGR